METFNNLIETTFDEIAEDLDGLQQYEQLHICSLDINTLSNPVMIIQGKSILYSLFLY